MDGGNGKHLISVNNKKFKLYNIYCEKVNYLLGILAN